MKAEDMRVWPSIEKALADGPKEIGRFVYFLNDVAHKLQRASKEVDDFENDLYLDAMFWWEGNEARAIVDGDESYWSSLASVIDNANNDIDVIPDEFE